MMPLRSAPGYAADGLCRATTRMKAFADAYATAAPPRRTPRAMFDAACRLFCIDYFAIFSWLLLFFRYFEVTLSHIIFTLAFRHIAFTLSMPLPLISLRWRSATFHYFHIFITPFSPPLRHFISLRFDWPFSLAAIDFAIIFADITPLLPRHFRPFSSISWLSRRQPLSYKISRHFEPFFILRH
jgi:hypothetical protein